MRIATWNVNSLRVRLPHVLDWLASARPDVIGLQETKLTDADFPADAIREAGYASVHAGQKTYNGVGVLALESPMDVVTGLPGYDDPQKRLLAVTVGGVRVVNVYIPNGQEVGSEKYAYKLDWLQRLVAFIGEEMQRHPRLALVGDFNIAPADEDVHDPEAWAGKVLCSEPERDAFRALAGLGLVDCFRLFPQEPGRFSWWDYRAAGFRRNHGLRIDLVLASAPLARACTACVIDLEPRRRERPSDHAPVYAEFDLAVAD